MRSWTVRGSSRTPNSSTDPLGAVVFTTTAVWRCYSGTRCKVGRPLPSEWMPTPKRPGGDRPTCPVHSAVHFAFSGENPVWSSFGALVWCHLVLARALSITSQEDLISWNALLVTKPGLRPRWVAVRSQTSVRPSPTCPHPGRRLQSGEWAGHHNIH